MVTPAPLPTRLVRLLLAAGALLGAGACSDSPAATTSSPVDASRAPDASVHDASLRDAAPRDAHRVADASPDAHVEASTMLLGPADVGPILVCNGHAELCARPYDQVAYPGTHGSYTDTTEGFDAPDQTYPVARQLADGIRVLHFEVHVYEGAVYVCHSICAIGKELLTYEMTAVYDFVAAHPGDVVTVLLERSDATITANQIGDAMKTSGLEPYTHVQAVGATWPTLGSMLQRGERLVALLDDPTGSTYDWLLPRWQLTWETPWDNETPTDFGRCNADRGTMGDGVYVVDTYLEDLPIENAKHASLVNYDPFLVTRLLYCQNATMTLPNFVMMNFYEVSDVFSVVDVLNGFAPKPDVNLAAFPPSAWPVDGGVDAGSPLDAGADVGADAPSSG